MKILMAASCSSDPNLGVPGVMHALADRFRSAGNEVRMAFRDAPGRVGEMLFGWRLARSQDARWADIVDSHAVEAWPLSAMRQRPAVVARSHGLELGVHRRFLASRKRDKASVSPVYWAYRGSVRLFAERRAIRSADASLLLNGVDLQLCLREFHADPTRLHLVRNGYPPEFLDRPLETNTPPGVLFLGSWLARKGNDLAVEAFTALLRAHPATPVLLVGTGVETQALRSEFPPDVRELPKIVPRFRREDLPDLVRGMSILLFPSRSEGYPLSLVEAMAMGIAPVASSIPGVTEVVQPGSSGILVPTEDASALSSALLDLVRSPERLEMLRRGARERVRDASWDQIAKSQMKIYHDVIAARKYPVGAGGVRS